MTKYFGTDGIRGKANDLLTPELALNLGKYLGYKFKGERILIAKDTRESSDMLEHALAAGIASSGAHAYLMGVAPTPALAFVLTQEDFKAGVMISASHNPYHDNGLKVFNHDGLKISDELSHEIEAFLDHEIEIDVNYDLGNIVNYAKGLDVYIDYVEKTVNGDFTGLKIVLDLAHGASVTTAKRVFADLNAEIIVMNDKPNGKNINDHAGSTHMSYLQRRVVEEGADLGFAFDGDADRVLASDHKGNLIDGDKLIYVLAQQMKKDNKLTHDTVVTTIMSNLGFVHALKDSGLRLIQTDVGDRHVAKEMFENDFALGGEQSGHLLIKEFATTGDGVMSALKITEALMSAQKSLYELAKPCKSYPQVLKNIIEENKVAVMNSPQLKDKIEEVERTLGDQGRILVRASGTEPLIRVMVEAETEDLCHTYVDDVVEFIQSM